MPIRISAKFRKIRLLQKEPESSLSGAFSGFSCVFSIGSADIPAFFL